VVSGAAEDGKSCSGRRHDLAVGWEIMEFLMVRASDAALVFFWTFSCLSSSLHRESALFSMIEMSYARNSIYNTLILFQRVFCLSSCSSLERVIKFHMICQKFVI